MHNPLLVPELREMLASGDADGLREFCLESHPATVADFISLLEPQEVRGVLATVPPRERALIFSHLDPEMEIALTEAFSRKELAEMVTHMLADERVDLLQRLPEDQREALMPALTAAEREDIRRLASYPEGTAGAVMTSDYAALAASETAAQAIERLRREAPDKETIYYAYVVDAERRLLGFVSLRDLILAPPHRRVGEIMQREVVSGSAFDDQERVAEQIAKYDLLALPIVGPGGELVGIVTYDDVIDVVREEATEDIQKFGGMEALDEPYLKAAFLSMVRKRAGWLAALFLGETLTATAMAHFEDDIARAIVLAMFIPLIISSGGNSGSQASTLVVRAMALGEVRLSDWWRVVKRELGAGLALGSVLGAIGFLRIVLWQTVSPIYGEHYLGVAAAVATSLVGVVTFGTLAGSVLPFVLRRMGFDPASASAPFVATLVDVTGLVIYFTTASVILHGSLM